MSETAITIGLLALVAIIGLWIGHFKIKVDEEAANF